MWQFSLTLKTDWYTNIFIAWVKFKECEIYHHALKTIYVHLLFPLILYMKTVFLSILSWSKTKEAGTIHFTNHLVCVHLSVTSLLLK